MKLFILLSFLVASSISTPTRFSVPVKDAYDSASRIINGQPARNGQFPWQVLNIISTPTGTGVCGGSLIASNWVLTAAHCADEVYLFTITLGSLYFNSSNVEGAIVIQTDKVIIHEEYDNWFLFNDIALVDLQQNVVFSNVIQPIPLNKEVIGSNVNLTVSGWGKTSDVLNEVSPILNFVQINSISNEDCDKYYGVQVTDGTLCCKGKPAHSSCHGDSGGPLVKIESNGATTQVGVITFVHVSGCANGYPSAYTRTEYYLDWIHTNMRSNFRILTATDLQKLVEEIELDGEDSFNKVLESEDCEEKLSVAGSLLSEDKTSFSNDDKKEANLTKMTTKSWMT
ncbi:hypothetical protein RN001_013774 [Aquatica leii]|uniref:Peptidase S1 domain-containing protein n=1 Tax=Aquatica leii TaxID=1421715 RepID=A0AAN7PR21_9COLE|nr:hypothetical protein RN001_013774 [Aquatica leii]